MVYYFWIEIEVSENNEFLKNLVIFYSFLWLFEYNLIVFIFPNYEWSRSNIDYTTFSLY